MSSCHDFEPLASILSFQFAIQSSPYIMKASPFVQRKSEVFIWIWLLLLRYSFANDEISIDTKGDSGTVDSVRALCFDEHAPLKIICGFGTFTTSLSLLLNTFVTMFEIMLRWLKSLYVYTVCSRFLQTYVAGAMCTALIGVNKKNFYNGFGLSLVWLLV